MGFQLLNIQFYVLQVNLHMFCVGPEADSVEDTSAYPLKTLCEFCP
jgi:hypothetical protein